MAFLRSSDYAKLKQLGGKLFQKYKKYPYLYWTAMAGFLQARACTDERMKKMNLEIAKRTIQKDLEGIETERQLKLYLMILQELGDWETIAAALEKYNHLFTETLHSKDAFQYRVWEETSQHEKIIDAAKDAIEKDGNDLGAWKRLLNTFLPNREVLKNKISIDEISDYISAKAANSQSRAPDIAKFIFCEAVGEFECWGNLQLMVEEYCQKWRSKSSTPFDIESFAAPLKLSEKEEIVSNLLASQTLDIKSLSEETKLDSVCASHLLPYQLALSWGVESVVENNVSAVESVGRDVYEAAKEFANVKKLMDTEGRPWDRHFLVAALMQLRNDYKSHSSIIKALAILSRGIKASGTCPDLLFLSLNLFARFDCVNEAIKLFRTHLDMKSIQNDSLGYVMFPQVFQLNPEAAAELLDNPLTFYSNSKKDTTEAIIKCFREGSFAQVEDIERFREALKNSIMRKLLQVENLVTSGYYGKKLLSELSDKKVSDNRDFDALNWWGPDRVSKIQDLKTRSLNDLEQYVRFRTGCLEVLQGAENNMEELEKLAEVPDFEHSEVVLLSGYHRMPTTECRKMTVITLKLLNYLRDCLIEKKAKETDSVLFEEYKKCFEGILARKELRSRWFIIESVMFILNFVKSHEQAVQDIKKGGKRIQKKVKEDFAAFVEFSNYLTGCGQESFLKQMIELESLVIEEDVSGIITTIKNDREEVRLTLNEIYTKYSSNLSRQLAKK
ncbi:unnamed protein product [Oikopleura dioica]|uniref:Uncharacterized protein n=1 Tax=Oikopleura dioica TaxID=34765 RepID=E4XUP3_OIKDI|nr:unnamed protein product [Oikopleura dioica]